MFRRRRLKKTFDQKLRALIDETRDEWEHAKYIENHLDDYEQEVFIRRKITESMHFYLYREAKERGIGKD